MSQYSGVVLGITPNVSNDNCALDAAANEQAYLKEFFWGGEATTTTAMRTRVGRASSGATPTAGNVQKRQANAPTNLVAFASGWGTQPTLTAGALFATGWNAHGGVVRWLAAPGEEFELIGAGQFSCRNDVGVGVSTYGMIWDEA